jgi:hypothetical protein
VTDHRAQHDLPGNMKISIQRSTGAGLERRQLRIELVPGRRASCPDVHLRAEHRRVVEAGGLEDHDVGPRAESAGDRAAAGGTEAALDPRVSFRRDGVVTQFAAQPQAVRRNDEDGGKG